LLGGGLALLAAMPGIELRREAHGRRAGHGEDHVEAYLPIDAQSGIVL
jgi:hypothetical protein